jgi:hypothetical protein
MMRRVLIICAVAALSACSSTKPLNPSVTTEDFSKIQVSTAAQLKEVLGSPTRTLRHKTIACRIWQYELKSERPFFGKVKDTVCSYHPTTLRTMNFCIASGGTIIQKELIGTFYVDSRCPTSLLYEVRQMSAEELASPRIPTAGNESKADVDAYYKNLKK